MSDCPHKLVQFCPLYVEAHYARGMGCDDGGLHNGTCALARGMNYAEELGRIMAIDPRLVAELEFEEAAYFAKAQRARNMRSAAVH